MATLEVLPALLAMKYVLLQFYDIVISYFVTYSFTMPKIFFKTVEFVLKSATIPLGQFFPQIYRNKIKICCNTHSQGWLPGKPFRALFIS